MSYFTLNPTSSPSFLSTMRSQGYDFVFVLFTKTTDWIENNAQVLEQVIQRVNATKTGNNKSTVIGISMGGLVARWALKDMEDKGINHQVGNYISYDAPHQGANVPLGLQVQFNEMLIDMPFLKYISKISTLYSGYTSYAAQEMLATYASFSRGSLNLSPFNKVRTVFAQSLINKGYPHTTTNYGISLARGNNTNGTTNAGNGTQFGFAPGSAIFDGGITFYLDNMTSTAYTVPVNGATGYICRYRFSGLKVASIFNIPFFSYWGVRSVNIKYTGLYPYDDAPGGFENTQSKFVSSFNSNTGVLNIGNSGGAPSAKNDGHFGHNFIPVSSSLDLQNQGYGVSNNFQSNNMYYNIDNNIVNPGQVTGNTLNPSTLSPFQYVLTYTSDCNSGITCESYSPDDLLSMNNINPYQFNNWNQWHEADLSNQAALFGQRKLLNTNTFPPCTSNIDFCTFGGSINGPTLVCSNTNSIYQISSAYGLNGVNIQWSTQNGLLALTSGQGTPQISAIGLGAGNETIVALLTNTCGQQITLTYNVHVGGYSSSDYPVSGPSSACKNSPVNFSTNTLPGATGYNWFWPSTWTYQGGQNTPNLSLTTSTTSGTVGVRVSNACDAGGSPAQKFVQVLTTCGSSIIVSPNPSSGIVNVSTSGSLVQGSKQSPEMTTTMHEKIYQIQVIDPTGSVKRSYNYSIGISQTSLNLGDLPNGAYILKIFNNFTWGSFEIVILK